MNTEQTIMLLNQLKTMARNLGYFPYKMYENEPNSGIKRTDTFRHSHITGLSLHVETQIN